MIVILKYAQHNDLEMKKCRIIYLTDISSLNFSWINLSMSVWQKGNYYD